MSITMTPLAADRDVVTNGIDTIEKIDGKIHVYTADLNGRVSLGAYTDAAQALAALDETDLS